ncbi:coiled-coil domain-containing protein 130 homolog [Ischnura elegans]|uniref:coiled-coil domain-containing protein 130 homolog n=1 Tax=Ischnura elegans TaxID=197161 RepID=UPI001ED870D2|nr:coiled-coil domain-containing protein 130 homolog [Ischnura elegans]
MGERKGTNKYYPPDYDPKMGGLNKFKGTHALRERARKIHMGILIIRFEMPYNIWCNGCGNHIGMGVRYNAEKKKVGMYYSTPIYIFKMKCHLCDNHFEIQTDPANLDYVIMSGARRQEGRWDPTENGQVVATEKAVGRKLATDAMFSLEHTESDQQKGKTSVPLLRQLQLFRETCWEDDYSANCALRQKFREKKKELKSESEIDEALLAKSSLAIKLVPESEEDKRLATLFTLKPSQSISERQSQTWQEICDQPVLPSVTSSLINYSKKSQGPALSRSSLGIAIKREIYGEPSTSESSSKEKNSTSPRPSSSNETNELPVEKKVALVSYDCESSSGEEKE